MNIDFKHIEEFIGKHVYGDDFAFQEQMRTSDLAIKELLKNELSLSKADSFFANGWGQVISAAYILEQNPCHLKISDTFLKFLIDEIEKALAKTTGTINPFTNLNVRGFTKPIMMYPHQGKYFDFKSVKIDEPILHLNSFAKEASFKFALYEGKLYLKINPENESNIFNRLWKTNFSELLESKGYTQMEKNTCQLRCHCISTRKV